jgi:phosphonopyruvate decarboxylase
VIPAAAFLDAAVARGITFWTGVPCSFLTPLVNRAAAHPGVRYVPAASEGEAVALAAGAWLAGRGTGVMGQNSGLGNMVNPLTSLNHPFRIPTLLVVTWRGQPGLADEPQHELMGQITGRLLETIRIPHRPFPRSPETVGPALDVAGAFMARASRPFALVLAQGSLLPEALSEPAPPARPRGRHRDERTGGPRPTRAAALERLLRVVPEEAAIVTTTGRCGRELFTLADRPQHLYQVGSMGCAAGMGLGVALHVFRPVIVLDGDGAALMKLGTMATVGAQAPAGLVHVVLDNGVHDSTGGQRTAAASVEFAEVALACGYASGTACDDLEGFERALREALGAPGPHLVHLHIAPGSLAGLGRPTVTPAEVARRFRRFLGGGA